jgi:Bax protein
MRNISRPIWLTLTITLIIIATALYLIPTKPVYQSVAQKIIPIAKQDFAAMTNVKEKKAAFFNYLYPLIVNANIDIVARRIQISASKTYNKDMTKLCARYKATCDENNFQKVLLSHIDIIPPALILAQAANESAWGTSRFAKEGNNYFGIWCFTKGCGMVPKNRTSGKNHEVKSFNSTQAAVNYYLYNLNTSANYQHLRDNRNSSYDANALAEGLVAYSERGDDYVEEIQTMIRQNKLNTTYDIQMHALFSRGHL